MILDALHASHERVALYWLGAGLIIVISITAYGQIRLNAWNQPFYDALARKDLPAVGQQLLVFVVIAIALLILNVSQTWLGQMTKLKLREGLTRDLFSQWLISKRVYLISRAGEIGVNPDQRIHADAQHLAEVSTDLGIGLVQASLLLASFVGVLWSLSEGVTFHVLGAPVDVPGYMVWCALLYASVASLASWRVGRPLVHLGAERYARESDLRFKLMHVNAHAEAIAIHRGEATEQDRLKHEFDRLLRTMRQLVRATTNLAWVTAGYGWFTIVAPIIVASPAYFAGNLTFGGLLMAVGAFTQVQQSLRWFVDNAGAIADWRATLFRVGSFRRALLDIGAGVATEGRFTIVESAGVEISFDDLSLSSPSGITRLSEAQIRIGPKEHVHIIGKHGSGKTLFFRAMAGLWTSGQGVISLPSPENLHFVPKRPYIPDANLREILSYPIVSSRFSDETYRDVLKRFGLAHLSDQLNRITHWEKELTDAEQHALAFARVLLHRPQFVIVDEAIDSLPSEARKALFEIFDHELGDASLLYISGPESENTFFDRVLYLTLTPAVATTAVSARD